MGYEWTSIAYQEKRTSTGGFKILGMSFGEAFLIFGLAILFVSAILAFLSGMEVTKRAWTNLVIIVAAVGISYGIGLFANNFWGISLNH